MGAYLVRGSIEDVRESVTECLEAQGFDVREEMGPSRRCSIRAVKTTSHWWLRLWASVYVEAQEDVTLVSASFRSGPLGRLSVLAVTTAFAAIVLMFCIYVDVFLAALSTVTLSLVAHIIIATISSSHKTPLTDLPRCYLVLSGVFVALLLLLRIHFRLEKAVVEGVSQSESAFWADLTHRFRVRLVALAAFRALSPGYAACYVTTVLAAGGVLLYKVHAFVLFCSLPFLVFVWLWTVLPLSCENRPGLYARAVAATGGVRVVLLNSLVLLLVVLGLVLTVSQHMEQGAEMSSGIRTLAELRRYLDSGGPLLDDVSSGEERMSQVQARMRYWAQRITEKSPQAREYAGFIEGVLIALFAVLIAAALFFLLWMSFRLWEDTVTAFPQGWRDRTAADQVDWIRMPVTIESRALRHAPFRLAVLALFGTGALSTVLLCWQPWTFSRSC